jgi:hypothetical protein
VQPQISSQSEVSPQADPRAPQPGDGNSRQGSTFLNNVKSYCLIPEGIAEQAKTAPLLQANDLSGGYGKCNVRPDGWALGML